MEARSPALQADSLPAEPPSDSQESACSAGDQGSIPGSGSSPGEGNDNPRQYSCLENPMDRGAWSATVHGAAKSDTTEWRTLSLFKEVERQALFTGWKIQGGQDIDFPQIENTWVKHDPSKIFFFGRYRWYYSEIYMGKQRT